MHPLLALLATRPQLLVDHAQAYGALLGEEFGRASAAWERRALLQAAALCCLSVAAVLAGVAVMLWVTVAAPSNVLWVLVATPVLPLFTAIICLWLARQPTGGESFANLSRQINADLALLRAAGKP